MSCGCATTTCTCGCCDGIEAVTPLSEYNPPGRRALDYRAGTQAAFYETMLARLTTLFIDVPSAKGTGTDRLYPLRALKARETSDASIALLDAWAVIADVLTFYQERIANEGYLATARERRSILELARLVGYRLRPGVAASVYLAFTAAQDFRGDIPVGTRAQSIPGPGERPQFFETGEKLTARAEWNAMKPRLTRPQVISPARDDLKEDPAVTDVTVIDTVYLDGIATNVKAGNGLIFIFGSHDSGPALRRVESVTAQPDDKRTQIVLAQTFDFLTTAQILDLFAAEAKYLFQGSTLAVEAADTLGTLTGNISTALVAMAIARLQETLSIARRRNFTRLTAWLTHVIQLLPGVTATGGNTTVTYDPKFARSSFEASPLGNLVAMSSALALAPSVQPANATRLNRKVERSFSPQSDIAARLLTAFKPQTARTLYPAWKSVAKPYDWVEVYAARVTTGLFASRFTGPATIPAVGGTVGYTAPNLKTAWPAFVVGNAIPTGVALDGTYDEIKPGSWIAIDRPRIDTNAKGARFVTYHHVDAVRTISLDTATGYTAKSTVLSVTPKWLQNVLSGEDIGNLLINKDVFRDTVVYAQAEALALAEEPLDTEVQDDTLSLDGVYDGLDPGRWVIVSGNRTDVANASGVKASELAMIAGVSQGAEAPMCAAFPQKFKPFSDIFYTTPANAAGDRLVVGAIDPKQFFAALNALTVPKVLNQQYCGQIELAPGFFVNAYVPSVAERRGFFTDFMNMLVDPVTGAPVTRGLIGGTPSSLLYGDYYQALGTDWNGILAEAPTFFAWRISTPKLHTILQFAGSLAYVYDSASVSVYGNVVKATHGQSTGEVLGNGSGAAAFQTFGLHQAPVTYVSAATPQGAQSTLQVRVNEIEWHEQGSLAFAGPRDRVFVTAADDDDKLSITFGNGRNGARLPTGVANVKATYRYGIGAAGNVAAGQISQLATQPLGVQSVVNPLAASGGADRDSADEARENTPVAVMALDRLVSVKDYADFARAFAGVGKSSVAKLSDGRRQIVYVTIAGARDIPIDLNSDLARNLVSAFEDYGDPSLPVQIAPRKLKVLVMSASVQLLPDYAWEAAEPAIRSALLNHFGFAARGLGQAAFLSEAVAVAQHVKGVSWIDFSVFDSVSEDATAATLASLAGKLAPHQYVRAQAARSNPNPLAASRFMPAELAILTPAIPDTLILKNVGG
jgi:hypothetical protein